MDLHGLGIPLLIQSALLVALLVFVVRNPRIGEFAAVHGLTLTNANLPLVTAYRRRTRFLRTLGGGLAFVLPTLVIGLRGNARGIPQGWVPVALGYLLGAALAEVLTRQPRPSDTRQASLSPRVLSSYVPPWTARLRWALPPTSGLLLGCHALAWRPPFTDWPSPTRAAGGPLAVLGLAVVCELLLRMIVARRQPFLAPDLLAADDAIRSSSLHALAGAGLSAQLLIVSEQLNNLGVLLGNGYAIGRTHWVLYVLSLLAMGGGATVWFHVRRPSSAPVRRVHS